MEGREPQRPVFILGPTGCGKSAVAVELARLLGDTEIVSADAYQVYRGMGVLTAAPGADELAAVKHHLVDFLPPAENNDAATHARRAGECMAEMAVRGKRAIVTGGSGLYVKFISHGISPAPPSDATLRAELTALSLAELVARLRAADPEGAAATDLCNARYVARNLEIVLLGGKPLSYWRENWNGRQPAGPGFYLQRETADLDARIARRAARMIQTGAIEEVEALLRSGLRLSATAEKTLGLSTIREYLQGGMTRQELTAAITLATRQYAKRQRTWLRRETWLMPIPVSPADTAAEIAQRVLASCDRKS